MYKKEQHTDSLVDKAVPQSGGATTPEFNNNLFCLFHIEDEIVVFAPLHQ